MNPPLRAHRLCLLLLLLVSAGALGAQLPSQRELNGFLLGQYDKAIAGAFTDLLKVDTAPDHWIARIYALDRTHHAYMAFQFAPDRPNQAVSLQIAGDSGTPMRPFLGVVLGDHWQTVLRRLGDPSVTRHESDLNLDLYVYEGRNYSLELDSLGRVSSIKLFGYDGFPDHPAEAVPSLDSLAIALDGGPEAALEYLAADLEVYRKHQTYSFRRAAFADLMDDTTAIAQLLLRGSSSVAAVLRDPSRRARADVNLRVWERHTPGVVFKFPGRIPIAEIVYVNDAGRWRIYEVKYR